MTIAPIRGYSPKLPLKTNPFRNTLITTSEQLNK